MDVIRRAFIHPMRLDAIERGDPPLPSERAMLAKLLDVEPAALVFGAAS